MRWSDGSWDTPNRPTGIPVVSGRAARRRLLAGLPLLTIACSVTAAPEAAQPVPVAPYDHVGGGNVMPPGNTGHVPATELPAALRGEHKPENATDQRDLYVDWARKDWSFAAPTGTGGTGKDALGPTYHPAGRTDVSIRRDAWGVPRIFGQSDEAAQFGVGYAVAQDRLFQADVFRHLARGEMAEFLGGQQWYDFDRAWRQEFYTDAELLGMLDRFYGEREKGLLQAYLDGINAYIDEALRDPRKLPAEYAALQIVPQKWELRHSLAIFVLQARDSVEGFFGEELFNAAFLADLQQRLGGAEAERVFGDVRFYRDPGAYATAPPSEGRFPYPGGGFEGLDAPGVVVPDADAAAAQVARRDAAVVTALEQVGLARKQASNAVAVNGSKTADGRPILLGGPQLAYLTPGIFWEFELHSPGQHARGVGFAGMAGLVLIGKSPTHAWSITYGYTDQVDTFLVPLDPARPDTHYLRRGQSKPLQSYTSTVRCRTEVPGLVGSAPGSATCDGAPVGQAAVQVRRVPEYGPVIGRVNVDGEPHAVVKVRGHWMREVANGRAFLTFNRATTLKEFRAAQRHLTISLNINYVDDRGNAGFWHVARPPIRAGGTDVRLPTLGDGRFDWQGFVRLEDMPHAINPVQGFTVNWNNQPGQGWHNGDQNYWGDLQRVEMLSRRMEALAKRGSITSEDIWRVNRETAFEDGRWHDFVPLLEKAYATSAGTAPAVSDALQLVSAWDGQRTASKGQDGSWTYDNAATTIFDAWVQQLQRRVLADDLGDAYYDGARQLGPTFAPGHYHLYSTLLLKILLGKDAPLQAQHDWLNGGDRDQVIRDAFQAAVAELDSKFEGAPGGWRGPAVLTTYQSLGLLSVAPHPFTNRGTYNQLAVVDVVGRHVGRMEPHERRRPAR
ncbi:MAG: penicillin acylase family protein [Actinomycetota bacterium]|nr:penicillin acylase family protein [Actinomycetota bacterium]